MRLRGYKTKPGVTLATRGRVYEARAVKGGMVVSVKPNIKATMQITRKDGTVEEIDISNRTSINNYG